MNKGTIEQIDYLRDKAGLSYEEAVNMLEQFDGDLARCMVELERIGRIRPEDMPQDSGRKHRGQGFGPDWSNVKRMLFSRVSVRKGDTLVANLTVISWLFVLLCAPWVLMVGVIAAFVTGCKIKWNKAAADPNLDFRDLMGHAAENIKNTADSVAAAVKSEDAPIHTDSRKSEENTL